MRHRETLGGMREKILGRQRQRLEGCVSKDSWSLLLLSSMEELFPERKKKVDLLVPGFQTCSRIIGEYISGISKHHIYGN